MKIITDLKIKDTQEKVNEVLLKNRERKDERADKQKVKDDSSSSRK